ncbi:polysialyltransferase family glycosyltransferase [Ideonella sp. DXS29W]|uniref:Polysialyltransferase family glycosyltransferase n=1 Tax=Ideonella lacteola TaxID=2984193 RepID=A0ABU9BVW8_9BURK
MAATTISLTGPDQWAGAQHAAPKSVPAGYHDRVALYFVASPLQYLAALEIAESFEVGARQVLVWYQPGIQSIVRDAHWDASMYMPWPRHRPMPGPFGRLRRLRDNIRQVAATVGAARELHIHSAVFDTEAINYFLNALPALTGAEVTRGRILPDGLINVMRYPLSPGKQAAMRMRSLRQLIAPELRYSRFSGDRIGSEAPFCDRIYVLPGLPHDYPAHKVVTLRPPPMAAGRSTLPCRPSENRPKRALVVGQPLVGAGLLAASDLPKVSQTLRQWLHASGIDEVIYKAHPKDQHRELSMLGDQVVELDVPLESWLPGEHFDAVVGVRSTVLVLARQMYGAQTTVRSFGWNCVRFKSHEERVAMYRAFVAAGVEIDGEH